MALRDSPSPAERTRRAPVDPRLVRYSAASRSFLAITAATVFAQTAIIIAFAWVLTRVVTGAIDGQQWNVLAPYIAAGLGLVLLRGALIAASERTSARGAAKASLQLRSAVVAAVQKLGPAWLAQRNGAALAVTAGHGLEALDAYFGRYLPQLVATAITMPILILAIFLSDPLSGITVVATIPLIPIFMILIGLATSAVQKRQYATLQRLASRFSDTVGGLATLKIFGRAERAASSIETVTRTYKRETMSVLRVSFLSGFALEFLASISVAIIAVTIGFRLLAGEMDLFVGLFVLLLAPEAYLPLRQVGVQFHAASEGVAATEEIFSVLDSAAAVPTHAPRKTSRAGSADPVQERDMQATDTAASAPDTSGIPIVRAVALRVQRGDQVLPCVSFDVRAGHITLVEGASGVGKSSILSALLGFAPYNGTIALHGEPIDDPEQLRRTIAWAGQRPGLMSGTIASNVTLGASRIDDNLVSRCLIDAGAAELAPEISLGAGGAGLSGGQAQRVAVARALYRLHTSDARILVLDEPSSALDAETEATLWKTLRATADTGVAILLVSHRVSARHVADHIVRMSPEVVPG